MSKICIELLERATEPDRSLDWEIHLRKGINGVGAYGAHPAYTASLDAALTLVPPHHLWQVKQGIEASAVVWMLETDYDERNPPMGYSTTFPAIALCIAALKAEAEVSARKCPDDRTPARTSAVSPETNLTSAAGDTRGS